MDSPPRGVMDTEGVAPPPRGVAPPSIPPCSGVASGLGVAATFLLGVTPEKSLACRSGLSPPSSGVWPCVSLYRFSASCKVVPSHRPATPRLAYSADAGESRRVGLRGGVALFNASGLRPGKASVNKE